MKSNQRGEPQNDDARGANPPDVSDGAEHEPRVELWSGQERRGATPVSTAAAVRESELRYRRLFESAKDGILILDGQTGIVTDVNPFLIDFLGYSRDEIVGKAFWEFGPFRDTGESKSKFRQLHDVEYLKYDNLPLETKSHQIRSVEFVSNLYLVGERRVIQCNIREITERVRVETDNRKEREEMALLVIALKARDTEMRVINRMNDLLQTCTEAGEAYNVIALMAGELFELRPGALAIVNSAQHSLDTAARWGGEELMAATFDMQDCWAIRGGKPHIVEDGGGGLSCAHFARHPAGGSYCLPLTVQGETFGLLTLEGPAAAGRSGRLNAHQLAESMGEAVKLSLSNLRLREKLREQAMHDSLTGLFNVRLLDEMLPRELHRSARAGTPLCIAMLDLDHFKRLNDVMGHPAGDAILRDLGAILKNTSRRSDICVRYGGEEFLIVLPDSNIAGAMQRVEEIRALARSLRAPGDTGEFGPVTLSAGIVQAGEHISNAADLIRAADNAMYSAKELGRDRVVVHDVATPEARYSASHSRLSGRRSASGPIDLTPPAPEYGARRSKG